MSKKIESGDIAMWTATVSRNPSQHPVLVLSYDDKENKATIRYLTYAGENLHWSGEFDNIPAKELQWVATPPWREIEVMCNEAIR